MPVKTAIINVSVKLPLAVVKDRNTVFVYTPALKLYGTGGSVEEATSNLKFHFKRFFSFYTNLNMLDAKLKSLGWMRQDHTIEPPIDFNVPVHLLRKNPAIKNVPFRIPLAVAN